MQRAIRRLVEKEVDEQRGEDFYLPHKLFEASKDQEKEPVKYPPDRFEREEDGGLRYPEDHPINYQRTVSYEDGHQVNICEDTACEGCLSPMIVAQEAKRGPSRSTPESHFETACERSCPAMWGGKPT